MRRMELPSGQAYHVMLKCQYVVGTVLMLGKCPGLFRPVSDFSLTRNSMRFAFTSDVSDDELGEALPCTQGNRRHDVRRCLRG